MVSAVGERAYCRDCFHGWRTDRPHYAYSNTAMCSLGTSRARLEAQIRFFSRFAPARATILEIGCATGELAAATRASLIVDRYEAIELSPAAETAKPHLDQLHSLPLREVLAAGQMTTHFDLILMSHVLEHIDDPVAELKAMRQVLKPNGAIFLEVPNGSGHRRLPIDDNRSHLHFFSPTSLTRILAEVGLETVATATDVRLDARYADSLQVIAKPYQAPNWSPTLLSDHPALAGCDDIIVWGAGSLAQELLANFFDVNRIDFFIDRDVAKVGTRCLNRPVRSPIALGHAPRTVLINSIDFRDAIIADIKMVSPGVPHKFVAIGDLIGS